MTTNAPAISSKFLYPCTACRQFTNALDAAWCECIGADVTPRCTGCGQCFCNASNEFKTEFWRRAPKSIHAIHRQLLGKNINRSSGNRLAPVSSSLPDDIAHPLVLIVDDSKLIRATTRRVVRALGYSVIEAADGEQALAMARLYHPELILSDALMPKIDGRNMCRTIKSERETCDTTVVIMSGLYTAPRYKYEAYRTFGADEYLNKPIDPAELAAVLKRFLGNPSAKPSEREYQPAFKPEGFELVA